MVEPLHVEEIRSTRTTGLFALLGLLFLALFSWRISAVGWKFTPGLFLFLALFFAFYVVNYRTLRILITSETLVLKFGLVGWKIDLQNIQDCALDDSPWFIRYGGAGVHLAMVRGMYRAFFNFLEGPRLLVIFREKKGWVEGLVFSTGNPDKVMKILSGRKSK